MAGQSELASSLDAVLPRFDIRERHSIRVQAPADAVFRLASEIDFEDIWLIRVIVRTREWLLAGPPAPRTLPKRFLEYMTALGWGVLSAIPDREIVMGAVTQPWIAHPVFRALPPGEFLAYAEPEAVKIAWGIRVDPTPAGCLLSTETRAQATDPQSRARFLSYWWRVRPGVLLIRYALLRAVRKKAEQLAK